MRLTPQEKDSVHGRAVIAALLVTLLSVCASVWLGMNARESIRATLSERSQSIAASLGARDVAELSGNESDATKEEYAQLKATLAAVKKANPDTRSIYLMGLRDDTVFFYVDSEQPDSEMYSAPGEEYPEATPENHIIFANGQSVVEGPLTDSYGTFISGLAPIFAGDSNKVVAVIGIDVDAGTYWNEIIFPALMPLLVGLVIVLIIIVFERIRRHNAELLALRSELVSVASHELRTPITGIRWAAESMQKICSDEKVLRMANAIRDSAISLQNSTNDILELSHATNGRELNAKQTDLPSLVKEVVATQMLSAEQKQVSVIMDDYWPAKLSVNVDPDQMRRAIHNVISNAIKYTRNNTTVTISYQRDAKQHKILVADQGIGIPAAEQSKVFRGFYRASNAVKSDVPGTGLGLYLVKTVFERHGGSVSFVSEENRGATFTLTLPR
jgi:signal transduction histidine kinase